MRVTLVSKALVVGAYQRKLEELARLPGIELVAVAPHGWREGNELLRLERAQTTGYELIAAPLAFNGRYHAHFYPTLGRILRRLRPDVLHMDEEPYNFATWHALRSARGVGARCLFFTWQNLNRRYPWPFRGFEAASHRLASHAIAGSDAAADVLRRKGYDGPVAVIPQFGVDPEALSPAGPRARSGAGAPEDPDARPVPFEIGYAGRLVPEKGIDVLLRACARLPFRAWSLTLAGGGPCRGRLEALSADLGIRDRVRFLGRLPSAEIADVYRGLDVLVLPSLSRPNWTEQFGRVLIEAMACGVPVIGSSSGEIPHTIGDAGLIFPEDDDAALGAALAGLAADPPRRRELAARGRARVLAGFTHAHVAQATAQVYARMMAHRSML